MEKNISSTVTAILQHITYWFKPGWQYPARASHKLKKFSWVDCLSQVIWKTHGDTPSAEQQANNNAAQDLITKVWDYVKADSQWHDPSLKYQVCLYLLVSLKYTLLTVNAALTSSLLSGFII